MKKKVFGNLVHLHYVIGVISVRLIQMQKILKMTAIYGSNASGKTNLFKILVIAHIAVIGAFTVENPDKSGSSIVDEKVDSTLVTEMNCDYITEFEKILNLERE